MALNIKNPAAEKLAREVAGQTGESLTEAIQRSLEERLERLITEFKWSRMEEVFADYLDAEPVSRA